MDNAVKAIYIAGGTLIALMVLSVFIYMFQNGARLGHTYEQTQSTLQVTKFNNQFDSYSRVMIQDPTEAGGYAIIEKGNTVSDVVTVANLVMSVNKENDYDNVNSVTLHVRCGGDTYSVYPTENQPKNKFVKNMSLSSTSTTTSYTDANSLDFFDFLKQYNNVRIVDITGTATTNPYTSVGETIYQYYFDVDKDENGNGVGMNVSEITGKIDKVVFTLHPTNNFDNDTVWKETR